MRRSNVVRFNAQNIAHKAKSAMSKFGAVATGALASGVAFAGGGTPGSIIAGELSGGESDMGLIFAAVGVLIGLLLLWAYTKRAAK